MGTDFTLFQTTTSFDRINSYVPLASAQLSDGTEVMIVSESVNGGTAGMPLVKLLYKTVGGTPTVIATIPVSGTDFAPAAAARATDPSLALCVDSLDNIYVIGTGAATGSTTCCKAYTKGAGFTWTAQTTRSYDPGLGANQLGYAVVWCNTGGGTSSKGHIYVMTAVGGSSGYAILDAGVALAGAGTVLVGSFANNAYYDGVDNMCAPNGGTSAWDISPDGFGATSGLLVGRRGDSPPSNLHIWKWSINSSGVVTQSLLTKTISITGATLTSEWNFRARLIRVSSNKWAVVYPSLTAAGRYRITTWSATAQITAPTDSGAPTSMPLNSAGMKWDAYLDPVTGKVMVVAAAAATSDVLGVACDCSAGITWDAAATTLIASCGVGTNGIVRATKQPRSSDHVDVELYNTDGAGNFAVVGASIPQAGNNHQFVQAA